MIKVYTAPGCPYCKAVIDYLKDNNYEFMEIDISVNKIASSYLYNLGIKGVPVTEGYNWLVIGYDIHKLKKELANVVSKEKKGTIQTQLRKKGFM